MAGAARVLESSEQPLLEELEDFEWVEWTEDTLGSSSALSPQDSHTGQRTSDVLNPGNSRHESCTESVLSNADHPLGGKGVGEDGTREPTEQARAFWQFLQRCSVAKCQIAGYEVLSNLLAAFLTVLALYKEVLEDVLQAVLSCQQAQHLSAFAQRTWEACKTCTSSTAAAGLDLAHRQPWLCQLWLHLIRTPSYATSAVAACQHLVTSCSVSDLQRLGQSTQHTLQHKLAAAWESMLSAYAILHGSALPVLLRWMQQAAASLSAVHASATSAATSLYARAASATQPCLAHVASHASVAISAAHDRSSSWACTATSASLALGTALRDSTRQGASLSRSYAQQCGASLATAAAGAAAACAAAPRGCLNAGSTHRAAIAAAVAAAATLLLGVYLASAGFPSIPLSSALISSNSNVDGSGCSRHRSARYAVFLEAVRGAAGRRGPGGRSYQDDLSALTRFTLHAKRQLQSTGQLVVQQQGHEFGRLDADVQSRLLGFRQRIWGQARRYNALDEAVQAAMAADRSTLMYLASQLDNISAAFATDDRQAAALYVRQLGRRLDDMEAALLSIKRIHDDIKEGLGQVQQDMLDYQEEMDLRAAAHTRAAARAGRHQAAALKAGLMATAASLAILPQMALPLLCGTLAVTAERITAEITYASRSELVAAYSDNLGGAIEEVDAVCMRLRKQSVLYRQMLYALDDTRDTLATMQLLDHTLQDASPTAPLLKRNGSTGSNGGKTPAVEAPSAQALERVAAELSEKLREVLQAEGLLLGT